MKGHLRALSECGSLPAKRNADETVLTEGFLQKRGHRSCGNSVFTLTSLWPNEPD